MAALPPSHLVGLRACLHYALLGSGISTSMGSIPGTGTKLSKLVPEWIHVRRLWPNARAPNPPNLKHRYVSEASTQGAGWKLSEFHWRPDSGILSNPVPALHHVAAYYTNHRPLLGGSRDSVATSRAFNSTSSHSNLPYMSYPNASRVISPVTSSYFFSHEPPGTLHQRSWDCSRRHPLPPGAGGQGLGQEQGDAVLRGCRGPGEETGPPPVAAFKGRYMACSLNRLMT